MSEDDKMQVGKIEQLTDKPDPDVLKALGKRWGDIVTTIRQSELARLQEIERLARAVVVEGDEAIAYAGLFCSYCSEHAAVNKDGVAIPPIKIKHADDCPWAQLGAALGKGE